ncbi:AFR535Cp [Eremothecium gossypii ATCC 10895]|uniref:AFR535Cp n=1 Tax=Eremothecium gossypii (strain ATCC 10895 / CBS 109.51 / FGSC 9923 / NRRL Y-1056) TaxID=284811 RepID=Q752N8_EREGS|nr:AFR535Cp [Eremothecium gossypii ATCC 10895]AAS53906.2 AFR535Cp [Eremothecium gossypii ATCC 10895]AEY98219.1 FAFR535Cp [Eremothecium gossypii FDAG1]
MNFYSGSFTLTYFEALIDPRPICKPTRYIHAFEDESDSWISRNCSCDRLDIFLDRGESAHFRNLALSRSHLDYLNERPIQFIAVRLVARGQVPLNIVTAKGWRKLVTNYELKDIASMSDLTREIGDVFFYSEESLVLNTQQTTYICVLVDVYTPAKDGPTYLCMFASFVPQLMVGRNSGEFYTAWLNDSWKADNLQLIAFIPLTNPYNRTEKTNIFHETMEKYHLDKSVLCFIVNSVDMPLTSDDLAPYCCDELPKVGLINSANMVVDVLSFVMFRHALSEPVINTVLKQLVSWHGTIKCQNKDLDLESESKTLPLSVVADAPINPPGLVYEFSDFAAFLETEEGYMAWCHWAFDRKYMFESDSLSLTVNCTDMEWLAYEYFIRVSNPLAALFRAFNEKDSAGLTSHFILYESMENFYSALRLFWETGLAERINGIDYSFLNPPTALDTAAKDAVLRCIMSTENIFHHYSDAFFTNPLPWTAITLNPTKKFSYIERMFPDHADIYKDLVFSYLTFYVNHEDVKGEANYVADTEFVAYLTRPPLAQVKVGAKENIVKYWFDRKELWPELSVLAVSMVYLRWSCTSALAELGDIISALRKTNGSRLRYPNFERLVKIRHHLIKFGMADNYTYK